MELKCSVQKYEWGKVGKASTVAQLASANSAEEIKDNVPYAELWMGVHHSGPSRVKGNDDMLLQDYLHQNPSHLGVAVLGVFGMNLPYLFKVLSVEKALSIQAHPSKPHAEELFSMFPHIYKDPNHKPEIAIALTDFEALCGFRPIGEIQEAIKNIKELRELLDEDEVNNFLNGTDGIRPCFEALMTCNADKVKSAIDNYLAGNDKFPERNLVQRLNQQFPGDVGVLCVFWLNYVKLAPGEALFLAPNEPHAYLYGDCVECMANSDNVVRAGLTPKFRDVATLCNMLTYKSHHPNDIKFRAEKEDDISDVFKPPVKDFAVARLTFTAGTTYSLKPRCSASILLAINGQSQAKSRLGVINVTSGVVLFLPALENLTVATRTDQVMYQAFCNF